MPYEQLETWVAELGQASFRARQLFEWIYCALVFDFSAMTNLPAALRERLGELALVQSVQPLESLTSADGLTTKTLLQLRDGETIESVLMRYEGRQTVCASSQVGCAIGCPFCATGKGGFKRNLSSGEIVEQVLYFAHELQPQGKPITNVVLMGMGEPLVNYEAVWQAIRILNDRRGLRLGARRFTISTAGLVSGIRRMAHEDMEVGLAISLHAPSDALRDRLVPLNKRNPIAELMEACREYVQSTSRRISFEYAMIQGVNDAPQQARELGQLLKGLMCHVNLIPLNPTMACDYRPSSRGRIMDFRRELNGLGIANTVRLGRGVDIQAGCGQLRSRHLHELAAKEP
jgi:23S rRNA (adenine2503-C2)-methyltransferase